MLLDWLDGLDWLDAVVSLGMIVDGWAGSVK